MVSLWQAHLSFVLLGFVLSSTLRFTAPWRPWLLPVLVAVSFIPVNELPLAAYVRSFTDDLAISTLVLLAWVVLSRLGLVQPLARRHQVQMLLLFGLLSLVLYPATLGLTYFDPYRWGFNPRPMIVLIGLSTLALLWLRNGMGVAMLVFFAKVMPWPTGLPWPLNLGAIIIAHVSFSFPFVAVVVRARLACLNR